MSAEALVVFVGEARCALPMERVTAVRVHTGATRIPSAPEWICGIVDQEGSPVELFDAAQRLGVESSHAGRACVVFFERTAMLVDDVDRLISRRAVDAQCPMRRDLVAGMIEDDGSALPLIDVDAFFAAAGEDA
jgi:chemotaxis signal transduction protein